LFYETEDAASRQFMAPLKAEIQRRNRDISVASVNDEATLESRVHLSGKKLLVLGTTNKYLIAPILAHLQRLQDELSYDIRLFGHPNWARLDFEESEGLAALNTRITSSYYVDKNAATVRKFDAQYQKEFGVEPTEFAYKGYDAAYYFGGLLAKYGAQYRQDRKSTRLNSSHVKISYAVF